MQGMLQVRTKTELMEWKVTDLKHGSQGTHSQPVLSVVLAASHGPSIYSPTCSFLHL